MLKNEFVPYTTVSALVYSVYWNWILKCFLLFTFFFFFGWGFPWWLRWQRWQRIRLQCRRPGFHLWVEKISWRRAWPTPVFLPGESPWTEEPGGPQSMGRKESDTTEQLSTEPHMASHRKQSEKPQIKSCFVDDFFQIFLVPRMSM